MSSSLFRIPYILTAILTGILLTATALGQTQTPNTKLDLIAEVTSVAENSSFSVAIILDPKPGWHVYWKNPGDNGTTPKATWTLPEEFNAGELQFPAPSFVPFMQFMSYGYDEKALFISEIQTPSEFEGPIKIECSVRWLVCDDSVCVPEDGKVSLSIPKGTGESKSPWHADFQAARAKQPQIVDWQAQYLATEESIELEISLPDQVEELSDVWFFPAERKLINHAKPQTIHADGSLIRISATAGSRWDRYQEIVCVVRTIPSSSKEKPQSYEFVAQRVTELNGRDLGDSRTRSPVDIKALSAGH